MEVSPAYERTRSHRMDVQAYFNRMYNDTYTELLKYVIIKTSNADQVDDILQNVYHNFYARISKKGFHDIRVPHAFLIKLAEKELARHYKRKAIQKEMEIDLDGFDTLIEDDGIPFAEIVEQKDMLEIIRNIVKHIPLLSYKSFVLFYYYNMSISTIARHLKISEHNVKNRLWRARNAVRKGLKGELL